MSVIRMRILFFLYTFFTCARFFRSSTRAYNKVHHRLKLQRSYPKLKIKQTVRY